MKRLIYIFSLLISIALFSGCDDFLTKEPLDKITDVNLTYTAEECKLYVNQFYTSFWGSPSSYIYHIDRGSDNLLSYNYSDNNDLIENLHVVPATNEGWGTTEWGKIRSVNFLLNNYQKSEEQGKAEKYIGEARFFRAMLYYEQFLRKFGGAPWIEKELTLESEELYQPRLKRNELADKILADLDWAIEKLPSKNEQETGRISKEVAMLYKARIALFEGTWEKYHANTVFAGEGNARKYIEEAAKMSLAVINSGLFDLDNVNKTDGYHILFNRKDYSDSKEIMLWKKFDRSQGLWHNDNRNPGRNGSGVGLTRSLVESYLCIDTDGKAKPIRLASAYKGDDNILTVVANRDPRLSQTMFIPGRARTIDGNDTIVIFTKPNINYSDTEKCSTGYELAKGADSDADEQVTVTGSIKGSIIFRYAEALLIYAEAKAELEQITQADLDMTVNRLRDRVNMPHLTLDVGYVDPNGEFTVARGYDGVPVSNLLQEIRRERRVELACEGYRYDDLKRWRAHHLWNHDKIQGAKTAQFKDLSWLIDYFENYPVPAAISGGKGEFMKNVAKWTPECTEGDNYWTDDEGYFAPYQRYIPDGHFQFDPKKSYLMPIPTEQLVLNPSLEQNPGWE